MTMNEALRLIAGGLVMLSVGLGYLVHPGWFILTLFVSVNLIQSAFTHWCPMMWMLHKAGLEDPSAAG